MNVYQLYLCRDFAFSGLRTSVRRINKVAEDRSGTAIMAYAFLSGLIAMVAVVAFRAMGTAVTQLYDMIATVFAASMPAAP